MKHKFYVFHSTILHTTRGQFLAFVAPDGRILKANFQKYCIYCIYPDPVCGRGLPNSAPITSTTFYCARDSSAPLLGPRPSCRWCPTCAPVRTTSWRRHCLEQYRHGLFTSTCPPFSQLFIIAPLLSFPSLPILLEVKPLHFLSLSLSIHGSKGFSLGENFSYLDGCR